MAVPLYEYTQKKPTGSTHLKMVNFMPCKLYLNNNFLKYIFPSPTPQGFRGCESRYGLGPAAHSVLSNYPEVTALQFST